MSDDPPGSSAHQRELALDALVAVAARLAAADRLVPAAGEPALHAVAEAAADLIGVTAASVALHDPATDRLVFRAAAGPQGRGVIGLSIAAHEGIAGYVFSTGQPIAVADVAADPRFERTTAERTGYVPRRLLAVPLVDGVETIGVLELLDRRDGHAVRPDRHRGRHADGGRHDGCCACEQGRSRGAGNCCGTVLASIAQAEGVGLDRDAVEVLVTDVIERLTGRRSSLAAGRSDRPPPSRRPRRRRAGRRLVGRAPGANRTTCRGGSQAVGLRRR